MPTPMSVPSVSIYWNQEKRQFLVQRLAAIRTGPFTGAAGEFGSPIVLESEEFDSRIASAVLQALAEFEKHEYDSKRAARHTDEQRLDFVRAHLLVNVTRIPTGEIRVRACERRGGSYGGVPDGEMTLDPNSVSEELPRVLHEAFRKAM